MRGESPKATRVFDAREPASPSSQFSGWMKAYLLGARASSDLPKRAAARAVPGELVGCQMCMVSAIRCVDTLQPNGCSALSTATGRTAISLATPATPPSLHAILRQARGDAGQRRQVTFTATTGGLSPADTCRPCHWHGHRRARLRRTAVRNARQPQRRPRAGQRVRWNL
jgi:hypothetical protein